MVVSCPKTGEFRADEISTPAGRSKLGRVKRIDPTTFVFATVQYPTYLRSTGIGWGLGVGRPGAIIGPILVGELIRRQCSVQDIFHVSAIPALISAVVMFSLRWVMKPTTL